MSQEVRDRAEPRYHYPRRRPAEQQDLPSLGGHDHPQQQQFHDHQEFDHAHDYNEVHEGDAAEHRGQGVRDIVSGLVLIGIGFTYGGSVFQGDPTAIDWFFDGLGIFWVVKGLVNIFR